MEKIEGDIGESGFSDSLFGVYQVQGRIGVGGMGEVYHARDTRLGRDVAIKILPSRSVNDSNLVARFQREARLLATLNHPNIGAIYGFETAGDIHALILELIDGDTLADRLRSGPIPLKDTLSIACQVAEALDAAHSKGVVHRDLKPANIKITPQSVVKVLDFGPGKSSSVDLNRSAEIHGMETTVGLSATGIGVILGTPAFMSPEQARGEATDKRTDIWAFGCVLYEMLTGRSAFGKDSVVGTLAAIVEGEPDLSVLPPSTPAPVLRLLNRCLEKDPKRRLRDIGDGIALLNEKEPSPQVSVASRNISRERLKWVLASALFVALGVALAFLLLPRRTQPSTAVLKSTILLPPGAKLVSGDRELPLAVAPDGSRVAFVSVEDGHRLLYVREMNNIESRAIPGTDDARHPFFSPDGQSIGYFAGGALQTVAVQGGPPLRICDIANVSMGGSWSPNHTIVFGSYGLDLMRVSDAGGTPVALAGSKPAAWPDVLPDGKTVLFTTGSDNASSAYATMPIAGGEKRIIAKLSSSPLQSNSIIGTGGTLLEAHVVPGYLLYGQSPGVVRALPFDLASQKIMGAAISLISSVERALAGGGVYFGASQTGLLVYASTSTQHQVVWVDRHGNITPLTSDKGPYRTPKLSPDGKLIAIALSDATRRDSIWLIDAERGTRRRLTTNGHNLAPAWTPDGSRLAFSASPGINEISVTGGPETVLMKSPGAYPGSWSPDGKNLVYSVEIMPGTPLAIFTPGAPGSPPGRIMTDHGNYYDAQFSPDGRWVAYAADNSGRQEVYVAHAADLSDPIMVSVNGGQRPIWARNGRELFYRESDSMMRVSIDTTSVFRAGKPERLFTGNFSGESHDVGFDITPDGQRFIMIKSDEAAILSKLTVIQNWIGELPK